MAFLKAQVLFWLIGATDGHAKNFSIHLRSGGKFKLAPLYDVLTAQPAVDDAQIRHNKFKLAMSIGNSKHYDILGIRRRHFLETAKAASLSIIGTNAMIDDIIATSNHCLEQVANSLPMDFPEFIHHSVSSSVKARVQWLEG